MLRFSSQAQQPAHLSILLKSKDKKHVSCHFSTSSEARGSK